jgi:flagella basal body P-ring formation protein FlgA
MRSNKFWMLISLFLAFFTTENYAAVSLENESVHLVKSKLKRELDQKYPDCRVEILEGVENIESDFLDHVEQAVLLSEDAGFAVFRIYSVFEKRSRTKEVRVKFAAWKTVPMAVRRIQPKEVLNSSFFSNQEVNVSAPPHRIYRGAIVDQNTDFTKYESKQTLMEGQYPLVSAIEKIPDVRRGVTLTVRLVSNGLSLSTGATALESGRVGSIIKVQSNSTKQELRGKLTEEGYVEVKL